MANKGQMTDHMHNQNLTSHKASANIKMKITNFVF